MPLGAGKEVGRSCVIVFIGDKVVMCDCGVHMGVTGFRRYPDFPYLAEGDLTDKIDVVLLSHFHLDHSGALPLFTEKVGYSGPLLMTAPTHSLASMQLEDARKITEKSEQEGANSVKKEDVERCMAKATLIGLQETVTLPCGLSITPYYAGHVLGAVMFHIRYKHLSVLYTGDYNTASDRHLLGAALLPNLRPDVLISESTYGATVRDSKRKREREFLSRIYDTVMNRKGKVLIPVFAVGRAQELLILLQTYWKRMKIDVPVYFSRGMIGKVNEYFNLYTHWTNEAVKSSFENTFGFQNVQMFDKSLLEVDTPMVLFATPGMLSAGSALEAFKAWHGSARNTIILPGYCAEGTVGHQLINNPEKVVVHGERYHVRADVSYMSFSAHADGRGILKLIQSASPAAVVLVHGDYDKAMRPLQKKIEKELPTVQVACPANGVQVGLRSERKVPLQLSGDIYPVVPAEVRCSLHGIRGFANEAMEQLRKRQRLDDSAGAMVVHNRNKWWEKWGIQYDEAHSKQIGPADNDCGCDVEWVTQRLQSILSLRPEGKYLTLTEGIDDWGEEETLRMVVEVDNVQGDEQTISLSAADAFIEREGLRASEHHITFKALLPTTDAHISRLPEADPATVLPSIHQILQDCVAGHPFEQSATAVTLKDTSIKVSLGKVEEGGEAKTGILVEWEFKDTVMARRVHNVLADTEGVAF